MLLRMQFGCLSSHWHFFMYFLMLYPCINFKAIWQLVIEILHLQTLRNTKSVITNAVVLVIGECHIVRGLNQIIVHIVPQAPFLDQGEI